MNLNPLTCDPERIELFLSQQLNGQEQTAFEMHLDDCRQCRQRLEAAAAREDIWSGVRESLGVQSSPADESAIDDTIDDDASLNYRTVLALLAPTDDERMLGRLGGYEVVGVIGSGGMGVVLKAFDAALHRYVAIKLLAPHLGSSGAARKRFSREAQAAAAVVHDNVIEIYGVANEHGLPYLVMPYVRGPSLQRRLDEQGPLSLPSALRIGNQAASGLAAAHAQGLVHRDVKPGNILLADGVERVKLTDFGLARAADDASMTSTGMIAGTPQYMSPEQARGETVDPRSDLFSLGSVMYTMCAGRAPFRAETSYGVLRRITDEAPRPIREINPDVPDWLCRIIERLMAKRPEDRFESAGQVAELLEGCLAHVQQPTAVPLPEQLRKAESSTGAAGGRWRLRRILAVAACAFAFLLAGVVVVLELNKGTLKIESVADDVPIRITQADEVVEKLTVTRAGAMVRIAAGQYVVEIDGETDGITVENETVKLQRGGNEVVKIVREVHVPAVEDHSHDHAADRDTYDEFLAEVEARRGQQHSQASEQNWRRQWLRRLLDAMDETNDRQRRRSIAASALGLANAVGGFENSEKLLKELLALSRTDEEAARWRDELKGLRQRMPDEQDTGFAEAEAAEQRRADAGEIARRVASGIERLKDRFPHLQDFSPAKHLEKNTSHDIAPPGTRANPELYTIMYRHGVLAVQSPKGSGPKRAAEHTYDPRTGVQLYVHFFKGDSRGADPTPPFRIGELSVHVYVKGPAAEPIRREVIRILKEVAAEVTEEGAEQSDARGAPRLRVLGAGGRAVADNQVVRGAEGYPGEQLPEISETPSHRGMISLDKLAPGTHWLMVRGAPPSVLRIELPAAEELIERTLPRGNRLIGKNLDAKLAVNIEEGAEFIDIEVHNRTAQTVHLSELDLDLLTAITEPEADAHVLSPLWRKAAAGEDVLTTRIEPGQTGALRVNWTDWVKRGFWFSRSGEVIAEPTFPERPAGKTWVRVSPFSALPVMVTHPDKIVSRGENAAAPGRLRRFAPGMRVKTIAASPDGKRIAIANGNPTLIMQTNGKRRVKGGWQPSVEILDCKTGKTLVMLKLASDDEDALLAQTEWAPRFEVTSLAFCPNGNLLAVGTSVGQVKLFDVQTGLLTRSLDDERGRLADERTPQQLNAFRRAMGSVASLAFSPDGSLLAVCGGSFDDVPLVQPRVSRLGESATRPGRLKVWDVGARALKHDLLGHSHAEALAYSPDGNLLASAGRWHGPNEAGTGVIIWDSQSGEKLRVIEVQANGGTRSVAFSPDGKLVAIGSQHFDKDEMKNAGTGIVSLAHAASGIVKWQHPVPGWAKPVAFLPDGKHVAALCIVQSIRLLDTRTGEMKREVRPAGLPQDGRWKDFAIVPHENLLAIGGNDDERRGFVEMWRPGGGESTDPGDQAAPAQPASDAGLRARH